MHVLIAGCGWLGAAVARRLLARGDRVTGVRSDPARARELAALGVQPLALDLTAADAGQRLPGDVDAILALQAARGGGEAAYRQAYLQATATLLDYARRRPLKALVVSGSTGLFTQTDGSDILESTPAPPATGTPAILAEAEAALMAAAAQGLPVRLVRLSGLYGPGRVWMVDRVRNGLMALGPGDDAWLNSCHQDDAAAALLAALDRGGDGAVYHATDAEPLRRREVIEHVAAALGIPAPRGTQGTPPGPNRRILGEATRAELGLALRWPSLRQGLAPFLTP